VGGLFLELKQEKKRVATAMPEPGQTQSNLTVEWSSSLATPPSGTAMTHILAETRPEYQGQQNSLAKNA
jgi:hypothetical protein